MPKDKTTIIAWVLAITILLIVIILRATGMI